MSHDQFFSPGRLCCALLFTLPLTMTGAWAGVRSADKLAAPEARPKGLSSLPAEAKWRISAALGRDQPACHAKAQGKAWRFQNRKHGLRADFTARGVEVRTGMARLGLRLNGLGRGARLEAVAAATPEAQANRVEYRRRGLTEWYVNGPLGLEQGFTLDGPPAPAGGEALTLSLRLAGHDGGAGTSRRWRGLASPRGFRAAALSRSGRLGCHRPRPAGLVAGGRSRNPTASGRHGARYPVTIDPIIEDARLIPSDGDESFGDSVAVDGDTVVVGADGSVFGPSAVPGSAYVFVEPQSGWAGSLTESARLTASDGAVRDVFGRSVAVSGDTVVVGAAFDTVGTNSNQGSAYIFVKPAGGWAAALHEDAKLTASDGAPNDVFGRGVTVSGDTVVVGAGFDDVGANTDQGSAYVFVKPAEGWVGALHENAKLTASDGAEGDRFGSSVAVSGDTVLVGRYVFVKPAGGWVGTFQENAKLAASDLTTLGGFAIDGDTVASAGSSTSGPVFSSGYVFVKPAGGWAGALTENAKLTRSGELIISSVGISGNTVVLGGLGGLFDDVRLVAVFIKPAGGWAGTLTQDAELVGSDGQPGQSVAVSGDTVVAAATAIEDGDGGILGPSVSVFEGFEVEAQPATTRIDCKTARCTIRLTCTLPPDQGTPCTNQINVSVLARDLRLSEEAQAKAPKRIRFAFGVANIPPGQTRPVKIKPTPRGRKIIRTSKKRRFAGVMEITNTPGTAINRIPIRIKLR